MSETVVVKHLKYLDSLRALAAIYVVFHHIVFHVNVSKNTIAYKLLVMPFLFGHFAVNLFIVLSGYCLMLPVIRNGNKLRGSLKDYFIKRSIRILPPYYFAMFISLILIFTVIGNPTHTAWDLSIPVSIPNIITHVLLLQNILGDSKINYVFWSVSVEWQIYFLFPVLIVAFNKFGNIKTSIVVSFLACIAMFLLSFTPIKVISGGISVHYVALFCFGMLAAQLAEDVSVKHFLAKVRDYQIIIVLIISLLLTVVLQNLHSLGFIKEVFADVFFGLIIGFFLIVLALDKLDIIYRILSLNFLSKIGIFAYSIYLIHAPFLQLLSVYFIAPLGLSPLNSLLVFYFAGFPIILLISYLFYRIAEKPVVDLLQDMKKKAGNVKLVTV
jgi:peptidoglycan/LPS O-acetylase OafA/YrhL